MIFKFSSTNQFIPKTCFHPISRDKYGHSLLCLPSGAFKSTICYFNDLIVLETYLFDMNILQKAKTSK